MSHDFPDGPDYNPEPIDDDPWHPPPPDDQDDETASDDAVSDPHSLPGAA